MWSQCVWLMKRCKVMGPPLNSFISESPSSRIPVPASKTRISLPHRTSTHDVLPPYRVVRGPGVAMEPRVPQKRTIIEAGGDSLGSPSAPSGFRFSRSIPLGFFWLGSPAAHLALPRAPPWRGTVESRRRRQVPFDRRVELLGPERLHHVIGRAELLGAVDVRLVGFRGRHDH